ncbi:hypothetical protein V7201_20620 [Bacillus sp. JJ1122]|uniref:hypothetical protein n=1 Tax=Bacillus sp. JJ1122 TaxID=3122951 RepID=UPI002FFDC9AC
MKNGILVFILSLIFSYILIYGLGSFVGGQGPEFTILTIISVQFSLLVALLFKILDRLKKIEGEK